MAGHRQSGRRAVRRPAGAAASTRQGPNFIPPEARTSGRKSRGSTTGGSASPDDRDTSGSRSHRERPTGSRRNRGRGRGGARRSAETTSRPTTRQDHTASATVAAVTDAPTGESTSFAEIGLDRRIVDVLARQSITTPFPIQAAAIPDALAGKDVLGRGPTGSGKTFTFGLPMLQRLAGAPSAPGAPRALVLEPTRELAAQVAERLAEPAAALGLRVLSVVGGVNIKHNIRSLAAPVDLLVATPGRAQDLINQGHVRLDAVEITALDEADQMADMGFLPQVTRLMDATPSSGQRLLFSATLDGDVQTLVTRYLTNPVTHSTAPVCGSVDTMTHYRFLVGSREDRTTITQHIGARDGRTIMFVRTRHGVDAQVRKLRRVGINAMGLHGDKGQSTREKTLAGFADGSVPVLVATDIAARGIDIGGVSLVVHVDPPAEHKAYMHRAGRTARGGESGTVVTLVTDGQEDDVRALFAKTGITAQEISVTPDDRRFQDITGAQQPSGTRLPPPGGPKPARRRGGTQAGRRDTSGRHRGGGRGRR